MSDELRECPFCGAPGAVEYMPSHNHTYPWFPQCSRCAASFGGCETEKKAVKVWNKRAALGSDALRAERDAAQAEAAKYKALWDAVPWEALQVSVALSYMAPVTDNSYNLHASIWLEQNAPQEEA